MLPPTSETPSYTEAATYAETWKTNNRDKDSNSEYEEMAKPKRRTKSNASTVEGCDNHFWFVSFVTGDYTE